MGQPTATIGVDLGTTTIKAIAFADDGDHEIAEARDTVALDTGADGAAEQDAEAVADAATRVLARVARQTGEAGFTVARVGLSAAMHSLLPVGPGDRPSTGAMLWMDTRADAEARRLWATREGQALYARTGAPVHAMMPLLKLAWLRSARPDLHRTAARFVSLKEWVWHRWFGEWAVDQAIANASGLYDVHRGEWDPEALAVAGIDAGRLSPIVPTTAVRHDAHDGELRSAGLGGDTPFAIGASDGVLANLGVGAVDRKRLVVTVGTSLAARVGAARPVTDPATRSFCYVLGPGRFVVGGASNSGGLVLDWLCKKVLGEDREPGAIARLLADAASVDTGPLVCLPYVTGERAPLWDAGARGVLAGLEHGHGAPHLVRAAVEGLIFNAYWIVSGLLDLVGRPDEVVATGQVLGQPWIRQLTADVFDLPVRDGGDRDASVAGAARLARIATGGLTWEAAAQAESPGGGALATPREAAAYRPKYQRFRRLADTFRGAAGTDPLW